MKTKIIIVMAVLIFLLWGCLINQSCEYNELEYELGETNEKLDSIMNENDPKNKQQTNDSIHDNNETGSENTEMYINRKTHEVQPQYQGSTKQQSDLDAIDEYAKNHPDF